MPQMTAAAMQYPGDEPLRQRLLEDNLGLVHHVARQVARGLGGEIEVDELVSAGTLGLMAAIESFDRGRGLAFSTFAAPRIRGAILDELRRHAPTPRSVRRKSRDIAAARQRASRQTGRAASDREVAGELGVDLATLWKWQLDVESGVQVPIHQQDPDASDPEYSFLDAMVGSPGTEVEDKLTREREVDAMKDALLQLTERERLVLTLHYYEDLRLRDIADIIGLTESRVSQIRTRALARLREVMAPYAEGRTP